MLQSDENFRDVKLRYQNPETRVEIYSAYDVHRTKEVIIKRITCDSEEDANFYMIEGLNTISERHPNICECYDVYVEQDQRRPVWRSVIVMEKLHHDLFEEIEDRKTHDDRFPPDRLYTILCELVCALAYLQRKNLAHRDIKPHNIFLDFRGKAKLGDFGSSKEYKVSPSGLGQHTMQGTPLYLSPRIREAYANSFAGHARKVEHNIYKSDVFSLGLTLVHAMTLRPPNDLAFLRGLEDRIASALRVIEGYERIKPIVAKMLLVAEESRPDFIELDLELNNSADLSATTDVIPELIEGDCAYCRTRTEVFPICHMICFDCFITTAQTQAQRNQSKITCKCGTGFPILMLGLALDPARLSSR